MSASKESLAWSDQRIKEQSMKHRRSYAVALVILITLLLSTPAQSETQKSLPADFDTLLMMATLRIAGSSADGQGQSSGTVFIVGNPHPTEENKYRYTLVTAAHVLQKIKGDAAVLYFRRQLENGNWGAVPTPIKIREGGKPLWAQHGEADVAAMYIAVPELGRPVFIPISMLANDDLLAKYNVHPGDMLDILGYPFGFESPVGSFPILRSGKIASYPLLPTKTTLSFLLDFRVFPGNSGGPVYINFTGERFHDNAIAMGMSFRFIMGLVSEEIKATEQRKFQYSTHIQDTPLGLAKVIHASLIRETIALLPPP